ncbi:hypothetical protein SAMN03097699_0755 [Flavobacteriaceae bacterium MAR_2010_188]|nr:hypothetical protein SAMN03097699_0755 [Flavobacteriaceae bacterium MAR_2010_188]
MKFTRYYSILIKSQGLPHLNVAQHCRLMNIISLESALNQLEEIKKTSGDPHKFEFEMYRLRQKLQALTGNKFPVEVIKEMVYLADRD